MKKLWDLKKVFSNLEPEGQGRGIIMEVTRLLPLEPFYTIQTNFMYFFAHDCMIIRPAGTFQLGQANVCSFLVNLLKSATILNNFNINHQQISLLKMPQVYSAIFYRLMMSFNVISYVSNNASHICCYRAKRSCFQHWVLRIFRTRGGKKTFSSFSCRFQNSNYFFLFQL